MENFKYESELFEQIGLNPNRTELKYSSEQISSLQELIESEDPFYNILHYMIKQKINVVDLIGYNYTDLDPVFNAIDSGSIEKEYILKRDLYQCCEKAFEEIGYSVILEYVKKVRKSPTRSKGQEFRKFMIDYPKEFEENTGLKIISDYFELSNEEDFIYIPEKDSKPFEFLRSVGVNLGEEIEKKGKDFLAKIGNTFYLGEVKNISTEGGAQNHQLNDMIITSKLNKSVNGYNVQGVGVLYGKVLFYKNKYSNEIESNEKVISLGSFFSGQWGF